MIRRPSILLVVLAAILGQPVQAQTAPIGDALMDRFIAALPDPRRGQVPPADPEEVARLEALNPGQSDAIRAVLDEGQHCLAPEVEAASLRAIRVIAERLGAAKVEQLIQFYQGEDARTLRALGDRTDRGETLSGEENARMMRILAAHPEAVEFGRAMQNSGQILTDDRVFMEGARRCAINKRNALQQRGLRYR